MVMSAVTALLVGFTVYVMISNINGKVVTVFGHSVLRVVTGSMTPSISVGDYIIVEKIPQEDLKVGDIISFYSEADEIMGMVNTHRIYEINPDGSYVTKGDANMIEDDAPVHYDRVIGKYIGKSRFLRWLGSFADKQKLIMSIIILVLLAGSIYEVVTIAKIQKERKAEKQQEQEEEHQRLIREAIEKEKERLREQAKEQAKEQSAGEAKDGQDKED